MRRLRTPLRTPSPPLAATAAEPATGTDLGMTLLHVAWLSIGLGLLIEALLIMIVTLFGREHDAKPFAADLVQKVSWSFLVCLGLAVGEAAAEAAAKRLEEANIALTGLAGLLMAPLAFYSARGLHRGAIQALAAGEVEAISLSPYLLAILRALEYGCLGASLGWIAAHHHATIRAHIAAGVAVGAIFGTIFFLLNRWISPTPLSVGVLLAFAVNEFLFPVGCSLVLYTARTLGRRIIHVEAGG